MRQVNSSGRENEKAWRSTSMLRAVNEAGYLLREQKHASIIFVDDLREIVSIPGSRRHLCCLHGDIVARYPVSDNCERLVGIESAAQAEPASLVINATALNHNSLFFLREDVARRLAKAAAFVERISEGALRLKVLEAFRPASPDAHRTGGAVDVTLVFSESRREVPMGTPWLSHSYRANTWSLNVPERERLNRTLLFVAMTGAGFVNTSSEWWHYSYGDQYWAAFLDKPYAHYGIVNRPR